MKEGGIQMSRQRTATLVLSVALTVITPGLAFAAPQPRAEWKDSNRDDRDSVVARTIKRIKAIIVKALEGPMIPPPTSGQ
jgi:hypothetical protein